MVQSPKCSEKASKSSLGRWAFQSWLGGGRQLRKQAFYYLHLELCFEMRHLASGSSSKCLLQNSDRWLDAFYSIKFACLYTMTP